MIQKILIAFSVICTISQGLSLPGGIAQTATGMAKNYEVLLSPSVSNGGAYLSSEFRLLAAEDFSLGFGYGSGELGFNAGMNAAWYLVPDFSEQSAIAIVVGMYFSRLVPDNYFTVKITPIISKSFAVGFGSLTPYAGAQFAPSFRLDRPSSDFAIKLSIGVETVIKSMSGLKIITEAGLSVFHSIHEIVVGVSYPFNVLGG